MKKPNITRVDKNLHTDNSYVDQPKGTSRFVLNGVVETNSGDRKFIANEEANEACYSLPDGHILIGSTYTVNGKTVLLSVSSDEKISEIGIADDDCNYVTHVNDENSLPANKLNFKISHQIDVIYRLRRGCEDTIYFVDGDNNKPRYYNFSKPDDFKSNGEWDSNKFELIRSYRSVPKFNNIEVLNSGGQLQPGSYNIAIQYLDEDLNPTEWITSSPIIYVYNDDTDESFLEIRGSINSDTDYIDFPITDKSIRVDLDNLDQSFLFYRLAFIEASNGSGIVNNVRYTENIPVSKDFFIYTGNNFATEGTEEEIQAFTQIIDSAGSIEQIENRLILGNIKGKQINFCKLQKYASRIKTDLRIKEVLTNQISEGNPKNPTVNFEAAGYMPGEIYSFGIVYIFADGSTSPVYHIPGKNPNTDDNVIYTPTDENIYPMKNNNASLNNLYVDNSNCGGVEYWGIDAEGAELNNEPVRHHRFPLRSELNLPLVEEIDSNMVDTIFYQLTFTGDGTITLPVTCTQEEIDNEGCVPVEAPPFQARVEFTVDGVAQAITVQIDPSGESSPFSFQEVSELFTSDNIIITGIFESVDGVAEDVSSTGIGTDSATGGPSTSTLNSLSYTVKKVEFTSEEKIYKTFVYGVQFSGIDLPTSDDTNNEDVIGYYIVRNERTESEKTILDSAAMFPCVINSKYISHGLIGPEFDDTDKLSKNVFGLVNPEFKFNNYKYNELTDIIQEGEFDIIDRKKSKSRYRDILDGTSYDSSIHKSGGGKDDDGWSLKVVTRDNITQYKKRYKLNKTDAEIEKIFYLNALESRNINDDANIVYNIAADNKVGILELKDDYNEDMRNKIPYLYLRRDVADSYSTFRTLPFYKTSNNITDTSTTSVFGGDTFITPMRYVNTVFWNNRLAERAGKTSVWNYIIGAILIVVGAILAIVTAGASTIIVGAGIAIIGGGALFIASGIKKDALVKAYNEEYDKGLRETALDNWVDVEYKNQIGIHENSPRTADTPEDDEIQWIGDCITDLWFESKINISIRNGFFVDTPTFIDAPGRIESGNNELESIYEHFGVYKIRDTKIIPTTVLDKHMMNKLVVFSPERNDSREYIGHPLGEWYQINPDYNRLNRQKLYYHLGIEYDCCSDCQEEFPHRIHYSEQSFQEELTDNYRVFLPNNYRDIEGEKGIITNLYRLSNNLYIHTEEALWHLPQNYQERITNDIVSFIGTGSYFETPPRLISDADESSAGCSHKWGTHKSKNGILFPSQIEKKWYLFNGNELKPISDYGNSNWFKEHMHSMVAQQYYASNKRPYPYLNNPSNPLGEGFISTYDSKKERLIVTKKDFSLIPEIADNQDYELCFNDGNITIFNNYEQIISDYESNGFEFIGVESCEGNIDSITTITVDDTPTELEFRLNNGIPFGTLVLNQNKTIESIQLKAKKIGSPDFSIRIEIWSLNGSNIPNALLETAVETYDVENLTTNFQWLDFTFSGTNYNQDVVILIKEFNHVFSASGEALISAIDTVNVLSDFPYIRNNGGFSWTVFNNASLQMKLNLSEETSCGCRMKFSKVEYEEVEETRTIISKIPNEADIHVFSDTSGSFGTTELEQLDTVIDEWVADFAANNPDWTGTLYKYNDSTEKWVNYAQVISSTTYSGQNIATKDIIVISFCNESEGGSSQANYHGSSLSSTIESPTGSFITDYNNFINLYNQYNSFVGIHYPIVFDSLNASKQFLLHSLAALKGVPYTSSEILALNDNNGLSSIEQSTLYTALQGANPYPDDGLENYGWLIKEDRFRDVDGNVIDSETFQDDINELLQGSTTTEEITVTVLVPVRTFEYVQGELLEQDIVQSNNSWTMSFDLKEQSWIGWHSYMPNHYFYISEKFYNWTYGNNNIYKHNKLGQYQTFNDVYYPHIIEYVSLSSPLITRIWDWLRFQTEAKQYIPEYDDFVDKRFITHNKMMVYNTRQNSGILNLVTKNNTEDADYLRNQIVNTNNNTIIIDREERDWHVNDFRDIRIDYDIPMFNKSLNSLQSEYFIDKILNELSIDEEKDWTQLENFRDKFLVVRFIFDNFDNIRLITNYSIEPENDSSH